MTAPPSLAAPTEPTFMTQNVLIHRFLGKTDTLFQEHKSLVIGLVILQFAVYSYFFTTLIFTNHTFPNSWVFPYPSFKTGGEGRWFADLVIMFQGGSGVQPFQMILAVIIQAINGILFTRIMGVEGRIEAALCAAFVCLYPALLDDYSFAMDHLTFALGDTMALAGAYYVRCAPPSIGKGVAATILLALALAAYQPKIAFLGFLGLCCVIMHTSFGRAGQPFSRKEELKRIGYAASVFLGACVLYFISAKATISYDIGVRTYLNSFSEITEQLIEAYRKFWRYYTREVDYMPHFLHSLPAVAIGFGSIALLRSAYQRHVAALALTLFFLLLIPVALRAPYIIDKHSWENAGRITFANGYALLFFLSCALRMAWSRKIVAGMLALFVYFFAILGTQQSNAAALKTIYDLNMINRITARIEAQVGDLYEKDHPLVVIGQYPAFSLSKYLRYENVPRAHVQSDAFAPYRQVEIINYFLGRDVVRRPTPAELERAVASLGGHHRWPSQDSVFLMDDTIVVVLEDNHPDVPLTWTNDR